MNGNVLEIPLICDKICKYLPTKDLLTCRLLNHHWNSATARIIRLRGAENIPIVNLTIENIDDHLTFLDRRTHASNEMEPLEWTRNYQLNIICDEICKNLPTKDLLSCRLLNHTWNYMITKLFRLRGAEKGPTVNLTFQNIANHLKFLDEKTNAPDEIKLLTWNRYYRIEIVDFGVVRVEDVISFGGHLISLIKQHGQSIFSMEINVPHFNWDIPAKQLELTHTALSICDEICKNLPTKDLLSCRLLNHNWNYMTTRLFRLRGAEKGPTVNLTFQNIANHLKFLDEKTNAPDEIKLLTWNRYYRIEIVDFGVVRVEDVISFGGHLISLIKQHGQSIFSMEINVPHLSWDIYAKELELTRKALSICDEICKYLSTKDLLTCRMLNSRWNSTIARIFKLRGAENGPIVNLTIENIETHLKFLDNKKPLEWTRSYQLEIEDCGIVISEESFICDKICKYLPTKDLLTCRILNSCWNSTIARIFKLRGAEKTPKVALTFENIETHLEFLDNKEPLEWTRSYRLEIVDCGMIIPEESFISFNEKLVRYEYYFILRKSYVNLESFETDSPNEVEPSDSQRTLRSLFFT
ncbi:hypothetical protein Bhyg_05899 [Pseudolycoriella hygida]|uniref:F-box domain-containing protein n=1 Tax=Pseudolycoriella hygida TaxID=35572 RepID=A0A9Q0N0H4_9DIPT|nr:hypothetical protein Bhyg_05899 [Pseudolycoriella hygida]